MSVTRAPGTVQHKDEYKARFDDLVDEFVNWAGEQGINVTATVIRDEIDKVLVETVAVSAAEGIASFVSQTLLSMVFLVQYTHTHTHPLPKSSCITSPPTPPLDVHPDFHSLCAVHLGRAGGCQCGTSHHLERPHTQGTAQGEALHPCQDPHFAGNG